MLERLICAVFGHRYIVERGLNYGARKVGCTRCGKHWAMHDGTRSFVPWDGEFEALYAPGGILAEAPSDDKQQSRYEVLVVSFLNGSIVCEHPCTVQKNSIE